MKDFELYGTVDVIYSTLDTLNYLTCKRDIDRVFRLVKNYLNYDGLFIFDVNTQYKFRDVLNNNCEVYNGDDVFCCWQSYFDAKSCLCTHELNYFEKNNSGNYTRFNNFQIQRYYSHEYFKQLAEKYSFDILRVSDDYTSKKVSDKSRRAVYTLKINK